MLWFCNKFFIKAFLPYALPPPLFLPVLSPSLFYHYLSLTLSHSILLTPSLPSQFDMDILLLIPLVPHSNLSILSLYPSFPLQSQLPPPVLPLPPSRPSTSSLPSFLFFWARPNPIFSTLPLFPLVLSVLVSSFLSFTILPLFLLPLASFLTLLP